MKFGTAALQTCS